MRNFAVLAIIFFVLHLVGGFTEESKEEMWKEWKEKFNKDYECDEEEQRSRAVWERRMVEVDEFNARNESFKLALNQFADMSNEEMVNIVNGLDPYSEDMEHSTDLHSQYKPDVDTVELPQRVDWREKGIVTRVKNQGGCGSCWAFSATGSLEGQFARKTAKLVSFSEQQLVDCSHAYGNHGCSGGLMTKAFRYWKNYKAETEESYPYHGQDERCKYWWKRGITKIHSYLRIRRGDCDTLRRAVALVGPVSVGMDASGEKFRLYSHGVYRSNECSAVDLDHALLVVGYNMAGTAHWIVKNSWGSEWGDEGYFKIEMHGNMCGICTLASFPVI